MTKEFYSKIYFKLAAKYPNRTEKETSLMKRILKRYRARKFTDHMGKVWAEKDVQVARDFIAAKREERARQMVSDPNYGYAPHVTQKDKEGLAQKQIELAAKIRNWDEGYALWLVHEIDFYFTGESVPILP